MFKTLNSTQAPTPPTAKRHIITAALPYANGKLHIGHLAGCYLPADIYTRFLRAQRKDVKFICASDEHGVPITIRSLKENKTPKEVIDYFHKQLKKTFEDCNIGFDIYSRTSNAIHHKTSQDFFKHLHEKGVFIKQVSEHYFDIEKNMFLADRYIKGTCPHCDSPNAYGDQCEKCGSSLSQDELIDPRSAISNSIPVKKTTTHWYFNLSKYEPWLKEWFTKENTHWKKNVLGQCLSWVDNGLKPRAMTRDADWGIQVPLQDAEGKVLYVWFDAPIGYISATKELTADWKNYWCSEDTELIHFIGKDNIVFHCIIFPCMLKEHGEFVLPKNVPANEFLNLEGDKISTSRDYAVWVDDYIKDFPNAIDSLRYVLCSNMPETKDNDFTWKDFQDKNNNELVSTYSNFVYRTCVLLFKLCNGKIPKYHQDEEGIDEKEFIEKIIITKKLITENIEQFKFREALYYLMDLTRSGNKYMQTKEPWHLIKNISSINNNQKVIDNCMYLCIQAVANVGIYSAPFMPTTAKKICHQLKVIPKILEWENGGSIHLLKSGYSIRKPEMLFTAIENDVIAKQVQKLKDKKQQTTLKIMDENGQNETISFEFFKKIDVRIGTIIEAEDVEQTDKLIKILVDIGTDKRTVVSGIRKYYSSTELIGKQVCVLINLDKRKIRNIESQGMLLLASDKEGKLTLVSPEKMISNGAILG